MTADASSFLANLSELLAEPNLSLETALADIEGWDSLNVVAFILLADREYHQQILPESLGECRTVGDLYGLCTSETRQLA
jgi:acyl carrier protein